MSERLKALTEAGVSIWLDDLSRERLQTGNLAELVRDSFVVGCTTNPTIFAASLGTGAADASRSTKLPRVSSRNERAASVGDMRRL